MLHRTSGRGAILYYIPPLPFATPGTKVAKTDKDSMRGGRRGLPGKTISIIQHSVDLLFFRLQCKQAPSCEVFVHWCALGGFPGSSVMCPQGRRLPVDQEIQLPSLIRKKNPWRGKWQPTPVFLPGESHEQAIGPGRL